MKTLLFAGVVCGAVLAGSATAALAVGSTSWAGVYDSVAYIEEGGDLVGMQLNVGPGPSPKVVVTVCEAECHGGKAWPATIVGDRIRFTVCDEPKVEGGKMLCRTHYRGRLRADGTLVMTIIQTSDSHDVQHEVLHRVRRPRPHQVEQLGCRQDHC